jgi:hypothetical protein
MKRRVILNEAAASLFRVPFLGTRRHAVKNLSFLFWLTDPCERNALGA